jgi:hypothetical protein
MPAFFTPNIEILPQGQRELWPFSWLGHRESIDFLSCPVRERTLLTDDNRIHGASVEKQFQSRG